MSAPRIKATYTVAFEAEDYLRLERVAAELGVADGVKGYVNRALVAQLERDGVIPYRNKRRRCIMWIGRASRAMLHRLWQQIQKLLPG